MILKVENVNVGSENDHRLKQLSCDIYPGQFSVIIGPNGAGKTSLIKVLSGEITPKQGKVSLDNRALQQWPANALAQRRAVLPQHSVLDFPFQVEEVVALGRSPFPRDAQLDAEIIKQAIETFDLNGYEKRPYTQLSGGERQRVHLARVWAQICTFDTGKPSYLLLDEPSSALDLKHQRSLMTLLKQATEERSLGVVAAVHDLNVAAYFADQLILLKHGRLLASGTCQQVLNSANIEQAYDTSVKLLPYQSDGRQVIAIPVKP